MPTAKNLSFLRARNQGSVLRELLRGQAVSNQQLAKKLKLTPMSISYITSDLLEKGIIKENPHPIVKDTPGRPAVALDIVPARLLAIGVLVSRRHLRVSLTDLTGGILHSLSRHHPEHLTKEQLTEQIITDIKEMLGHAPADNILGIGVSCIGLVDVHCKAVLATTDFHSIADWHIGEILEKEFEKPCFVAEDMKASALAEHYYGAAQSLSDFIYLGLTYGLGAGVITHGKLLEGNRGFCGEIGHTTLYHDGKECTCGNHGCAEMYLGIAALLSQSRCKNWEQFITLCKEQPENETVVQMTHDLATLLVNTVNTFDTEAIIIGHEGAALSEEIFAALSEQVNARILARSVKQVAILPSAISARVHAVGAAAIVFSRLFAGDFKL